MALCGVYGEEKERQQLKQSVREGLDSDYDFAALFPPEKSSLERLEAIAETLLEFLTSLDGGLITPEMWTAIEHRMAEHERTKRKLSGEEERAWILEILSSAPAHNISFTFITFMLSHAANEIAPRKLVTLTPRTSKESSREPRSAAAESDAFRVRRQEVDAGFAALFAEAVIRAPAITREKERKASETRRRTVVELFLHDSWDSESV